eukprot:2497898-Lingulodinium_polyedra.AAC.1
MSNSRLPAVAKHCDPVLNPWMRSTAGCLRGWLLEADIAISSKRCARTLDVVQMGRKTDPKKELWS